MKNSIRHGDIHLLPCVALPINAQKLLRAKTFVLSHGESGNTHTLTLDREFDIYEAEGVRYVVVPVGDPALLTHQEHDDQDVPAGVYRQGQEIEFDPFLDHVRSVAD